MFCIYISYTNFCFLTAIQWMTSKSNSMLSSKTDLRISFTWSVLTNEIDAILYEVRYTNTSTLSIGYLLLGFYLQIPGVGAAFYTWQHESLKKKLPHKKEKDLTKMHVSVGNNAKKSVMSLFVEKKASAGESFFSVKRTFIFLTWIVHYDDIIFLPFLPFCLIWRKEILG